MFAALCGRTIPWSDTCTAVRWVASKEPDELTDENPGTRSVDDPVREGQQDSDRSAAQGEDGSSERESAREAKRAPAHLFGHP